MIQGTSPSRFTQAWTELADARIQCHRCLDKIPESDRNCIGFALRTVGMPRAPHYLDTDEILHRFGKSLIEISRPFPGAIILFQFRSTFEIEHAAVMRYPEYGIVDQRAMNKGDVQQRISLNMVRAEYPRHDYFERYFWPSIFPDSGPLRYRLNVQSAPRISGPLEALISRAESIDRAEYSSSNHHDPLTFVNFVAGIIPSERIVEKFDIGFCRWKLRKIQAPIEPGNIARMKGRDGEMVAVVTHTSPELLVAYRPAYQAPVERNVRLSLLAETLCGKNAKATYWTKREPLTWQSLRNRFFGKKETVPTAPILSDNPR